MKSNLLTLIFGGFLVASSFLMLAIQRRASRNLAASQTDENERKFLRRRIVRRTQVAGMVLVIGIMIFIGDIVIGENWKQAPGTFAVYWIVVIGLAIWTGLLAVGDMAATSAHMATELNQLHRRNLELQNLAKQIQETENKRSSGK